MSVSRNRIHSKDIYGFWRLNKRLNDCDALGILFQRPKTLLWEYMRPAWVKENIQLYKRKTLHEEVDQAFIFVFDELMCYDSSSDIISSDKWVRQMHGTHEYKVKYHISYIVESIIKIFSMDGLDIISDLIDVGITHPTYQFKWKIGVIWNWPKARKHLFWLKGEDIYRWVKCWSSYGWTCIFFVFFLFVFI